MLSIKEERCVEKSHQAKLTVAKARLTELKNNGIPFDGPGITLTGGIDWHESIVGKIKQIALLPLVLVFVLVAFALTPIAYVLHMRKVCRKRQELQNEITVLESESLSDQVPDDKDVESLWRLHGLDECKYSLDERVNLLDAWMGVLYGEDVSKNLRLQERAEEIAGRNLEANLRCYEDKDAPHFRFASSVDSLARQVSEELSAYQ